MDEIKPIDTEYTKPVPGENYDQWIKRVVREINRVIEEINARIKELNKC